MAKKNILNPNCTYKLLYCNSLHWTWGKTLVVSQLFKTLLDKATVGQTWCCWQSCSEGVVGLDDLQRSLLTLVYQGGQQHSDQEWRVPVASRGGPQPSCPLTTHKCGFCNSRGAQGPAPSSTGAISPSWEGKQKEASRPQRLLKWQFPSSARSVLPQSSLRLSPIWRLLSTTPSSRPHPWPRRLLPPAPLLWESPVQAPKTCLAPVSTWRSLSPAHFENHCLAYFTASSKHLWLSQSPFEIFTLFYNHFMQLPKQYYTVQYHIPFLLYEIIYFDICMGNDCDTFSNSFTKL